MAKRQSFRPVEDQDSAVEQGPSPAASPVKDVRAPDRRSGIDRRQMGTYIAVCGPIGAGKSTIAEALAKDLDALFIPEQFDVSSNPFLPKFYAERTPDPVPDGSVDTSPIPTWSLATELSFLVQRVDLVKDITVMLSKGQTVVTDWAAPQNLIFSRLTLPSDEFALYHSLYTRMMQEVRLPDLIVCLDAPLSVLTHRITTRGRAMETGLAAPYLSAVRHGFSAWRTDPPAKALWLDTANFSIKNPYDRSAMFTKIKAQLSPVNSTPAKR